MNNETEKKLKLNKKKFCITMVLCAIVGTAALVMGNIISKDAKIIKEKVCLQMLQECAKGAEEAAASAQIPGGYSIPSKALGPCPTAADNEDMEALTLRWFKTNERLIAFGFETRTIKTEDGYKTMKRFVNEHPECTWSANKGLHLNAYKGSAEAEQMLAQPYLSGE